MNNALSIGLLAATAALCSWVGVGIYRRWAKERVLDIPNERSSHSRPTPRGGGVVIVVVALVLWLISEHAHPPIRTGAWSLWAGACGVALVGWLDDVYTLSSKLRLIVHGVVALLATIGIGKWDTVTLPLLSGVNLGWLGFAVIVVWVVGMINAYNFMDGIDGIAGTQALIAGAGWFMLAATGGGRQVAVLGLVLAASSLGFLIHNWQPARVFMGDVASGFLGYMFAILPLMFGQEQAQGDALWWAVLLLWPFLFDTVLTFLRRLIRGENVLEAHRSHLYQRLVISGLSHQTVTLLYAALAALGFALAVINQRYATTSPYTLIVVLLSSASLLLFVGHREHNQELSTR